MDYFITKTVLYKKMEVSREVENYCLVTETGAELFIPNFKNKREVAEKHREKKQNIAFMLRKTLQNKDDVKSVCSDWVFKSDNGSRKRAQ